VKKLLNTVYVTTEGASLRKDGENLIAEVDGEERARVPLHMLGSVVVFGAIYISPALIQACASAGISIVLLDRAGRFQARIEGPISGNVLLRREQYRVSEAPDEIVRSLVLGKIANQRSVLQRALRDHGEEIAVERREAIGGAITRLGMILRRVGLSNDGVELLRGAEGEAGRIYFGVFNDLIRVSDSGIAFKGRSRRPPLDPVNALLSFLYTLLTHDCRSAAESVLHRERPGRPSLALDLMEELRPVLADRLALALFNRRQIGIKDFAKQDNGAVLLSDEARKTVLAAWQVRKRAERRHPFSTRSRRSGSFPTCKRNSCRVICAATSTPIRRGSGSEKARCSFS
jgi:CRISP-associated protein Cas1